ncbi:MAG: pyridoxal 5'-phosphate synthase glutaminase subunit PdxT [Dehalococcoidia bacterium]|nr:pyridoxal 5'-phosphate synthase glutaminase subunit PdxT [Dehalococcoidia bacterium]
MKTGVLALQGDFAEHITVLRRLGSETVEVRLPRDLEGIDALIMPGGESTTFGYLMGLYHLKEPIKEMAHRGVPIWGTCAGMIMMARELTEDEPVPLGLMDIQVVRNAFGRQVDSFEADLEVEPLGPEKFTAVFIRAPVIAQVGEGIRVLSRLDDGRPVAVQQGLLLATSFHPELTDDVRLHRYFLSLASAESPETRRPAGAPQE